MKKKILWAEFLGVFILTPGLLTLASETLPVQRFIFSFLWAMMLYCVLVFWKNRESVFNLHRPIISRKIITTFLGLSTALLLYTYFFENHLLFNFISNKPKAWATVMVLYPLLSVFPQEIVYRSFFFERYKTIFKNTHVMVFVNSIAFGWSHIVLQSWVAVLFSAAGSVLFAYNYAKNKSLSLVILEHSLYGNMIFTLGLGWYFYSGRLG